jgi:hypothetical protein
MQNIHLTTPNTARTRFWTSAAMLVAAGRLIDYETTSIEAAAFTIATIGAAIQRSHKPYNLQQDSAVQTT